MDFQVLHSALSGSFFDGPVAAELRVYSQQVAGLRSAYVAHTMCTQCCQQKYYLLSNHKRTRMPYHTNCLCCFAGLKLSILTQVSVDHKQNACDYVGAPTQILHLSYALATTLCGCMHVTFLRGVRYHPTLLYVCVLAHFTCRCANMHPKWA